MNSWTSLVYLTVFQKKFSGMYVWIIWLTDVDTPQKDGAANERMAIAQLNSCIIEHNDVIQRVAKLEDLFSMQCMIQFLSSSITICIILFQASVVRTQYSSLMSNYLSFLKQYLNIYISLFQNIKDIKKFTTFIGFLAGALVQLFMFAKYGQRLLNQVPNVNHQGWVVS